MVSKIKILLKYLSVVTAVLLIPSCSYTVEEELPQVNPCDTMNVSYRATIENIFSNNCLPCHGRGTNAGGISLDDYNSVKATVDGGRLLGSIRHDVGFIPMPEEAGKLSNCNLDRISAWINQGALDN